MRSCILSRHARPLAWAATRRLVEKLAIPGCATCSRMLVTMLARGRDREAERRHSRHVQAAGGRIKLVTADRSGSDEDTALIAPCSSQQSALWQLLYVYLSVSSLPCSAINAGSRDWRNVIIMQSGTGRARHTPVTGTVTRPTFTRLTTLYYSLGRSPLRTSP